jgi:glucose-1-phosphatase
MNISNTIQAVCFDIGGILIELNGDDHLREFYGPGMSRAEVWDKWMHSPAVHAHETGQIKAAEFGRAFLAENGAAVTDSTAAHFLSRFDSWLVGPYAGARELVAETSARYNTALLTNMSAVHWPTVEAFGLHIGPNHFVKSYEVGIMKPNTAYFARALQMIGVEAKNTVFFDDSERNVAAAKAVGMHAYCLIGAKAVREKMQELQLLA